MNLPEANNVGLYGRPFCLGIFFALGLPSERAGRSQVWVSAGLHMESRKFLKMLTKFSLTLHYLRA